LGFQSAVDGPPGLAGIVAAERAGGRDGDENPVGVAGIQNDRVQAHSSGSWLPLWPRAVAAQGGQVLPVLSAVARTEQRGVLHARVHRVRIAKRRLQVPDALELPRMLRAVVKLVRGQRLAGSRGCVVHEFVARGFGRSLLLRFARRRARLYPRFAAVVGALN